MRVGNAFLCLDRMDCPRLQLQVDVFSGSAQSRPNLASCPLIKYFLSKPIKIVSCCDNPKLIDFSQLFQQQLSHLTFTSSLSLVMPIKSQKITRPRPRRHRSRRALATAYGTYIYRVLKTIHPKQGMSKKAMSIMNSFVNDTFEKIAVEAGHLCQRNKTQTLGSREVQAATRLVLSGELAKHAISEGTKAIVTFKSS